MSSAGRFDDPSAEPPILGWHMSSYADEQRRRNFEGRDSWDRFTDHRTRVTDLLMGTVRSEHRQGPTLCVLGAGNCNDLDLNLLSSSYGQIHLVDLDCDALSEGIQRQGINESESLVRHVGDLIGLVENADSMTQAELLKALEKVPQISNLKHDVVASICTLSQLVEFGAKVLGHQNRLLATAILALRKQHLQLMAELLKPRGMGLLITDFVSSDTCPELRDINLDQLPAAAGRWIAERNFFTGVNPFAIKQFLQCEMTQEVDGGSVILHQPWKWDFGPRTYAVTAIQFRRGGESESPDEK